MTRPMLKEERELRRHLHRYYIVATSHDRELSRLITAFRCALQKDEREVCLAKFNNHVHDDDRFGCDCVTLIHDAIRRNK